MLDEKKGRVIGERIFVALFEKKSKNRQRLHQPEYGGARDIELARDIGRREAHVVAIEQLQNRQAAFQTRYGIAVGRLAQRGYAGTEVAKRRNSALTRSGPSA